MTSHDEAICTLLDRLEKHPRAALADLLDRERPLVVARAPGRLDLMGGSADYSGATALESPLRAAVYVAVQKSSTLGLRAASIELEDAKRHRYAEISPAELSKLLEATDDLYENARTFFGREEKNAWLAYVAGTLLVLAHEHAVLPSEGLSVVVASDIPEGKGLGSSAAVEVATMTALAALFGIFLTGEQIARACQRVENQVVGAPSGVMDQLAVEYAEEGRLLEVDCQNGKAVTTLRVPESLSLWGIDCGVRRSIKRTGYVATRVAAFMGYRIIAELCGYEVASGDTPGHVRIADVDFGGFLANIDVHQFNRRFLENVPERMQGAAFLERYRGTTDPVTQVDPARSYRVRAATAHSIQEQQRIKTFATLFEGAGSGSASLLAELMRQSHQSYSECGLGTKETDLLVQLVTEAAGLHGAKITASGGGGTVAVLGDRDADAVVYAVTQAYQSHTGKSAHILSGSSPGVLAWGTRQGRYRLGSWWLD